MDPKRARQFLPFRNRPNKHGSAGSHDQGERRRNTSMNTGPAKNTYERTRTYVRTFWQAIWHPMSDPLAAVAHKSTFPCGKASTRYLADSLAGKTCARTSGEPRSYRQKATADWKAAEQPADGPHGGGGATVRDVHHRDRHSAPAAAYRHPPHARRTARVVGDDRRCDSSRSVVGPESEAVVEARLLDKTLPARGDATRERRAGAKRHSRGIGRVRSRPATPIRRSPGTTCVPARRAR